MISRNVQQMGFVPIETAAKQQRRLMISSMGPSNSGKTEFALSAPGPIGVIALDRGIEGLLLNPNPPAARCKEIGVKIIPAPKAGTMQQKDFADYYLNFRSGLYGALDTPDLRAVVMDGDSDSWEIQRLATFGKLTQVPPLLYTEANTQRRALYARCYDSRKIVIATNKVKRLYKTVLDDNGDPVKMDNGQDKREWDGTSYTRQGFEDADYLFQIQLLHMTRTNPKTDAHEFGCEIVACKPDPNLVGYRLWGDECNFRGLVETVFPHIPAEEWGF